MEAYLEHKKCIDASFLSSLNNLVKEFKAAADNLVEKHTAAADAPPAISFPTFGYIFSYFSIIATFLFRTVLVKLKHGTKNSIITWEQMKDWLGPQKMVSNSVVDAIGRTIAEESKEHEVKKIVVDSCIEVCKNVLQSSFVLPILCSDSDVILWGDLSKLKSEGFTNFMLVLTVSDFTG